MDDCMWIHLCNMFGWVIVVMGVYRPNVSGCIFCQKLLICSLSLCHF